MDDKRNKLRQTGCEVPVPKFKFTAPTNSKRRDEDCATTVVVPRKVYVPEEGTPAPAGAFEPLAPLVYNNTELTVSCPEGTFGPDVVVESGAFSTSVSFYAPQLPRLTDQQERYIVSEIDTIRPILETGTVNSPTDVRTLLKVSTDYATILFGLITDAKQLVQLLAVEAGDSVACLYRSAPFTAYCPDGTVGIPIEREEGFRTSAVSQEQANTLATNATSPECFFCNEEVVVGCPPADSDLVTVSGLRTIPAGSICETDKQVMLDRVQIEIDTILSECLYCNKLGYVKACPADAVGQTLELPAQTFCFSTPEEVLAAIAEFENLVPDCDYFNSPVSCQCDDKAVKEISPLYDLVIPGGTIPGESVADATEQANELCLASLQCKWRNEAQRDNNCGSGEVAISEGFVPKDYITSDISQEDADEQAKSLAALFTVCAGEDDGGGGGPGGPGGGGAQCNSKNACGPTALSQDVAQWLLGPNPEGVCNLAGLMSLTQGAGNVPENDNFDLLCRYDIKAVDCDANELSTADAALFRELGLSYSYRLHIKRPDDIHDAKTCKECTQSVSLIHNIQQPPDDKPLLSPLKQLNLKGVKSTDDITPNDGPCLTFNTIGYNGPVTVLTDVTLTEDILYKTFSVLEFRNGLLKTVDGQTGSGTTVDEGPTDVWTGIIG